MNHRISDRDKLILHHLVKIKVLVYKNNVFSDSESKADLSQNLYEYLCTYTDKQLQYFKNNPTLITTYLRNHLFNSLRSERRQSDFITSILEQGASFMSKNICGYIDSEWLAIRNDFNQKLKLVMKTLTKTETRLLSLYLEFWAASNPGSIKDNIYKKFIQNHDSYGYFLKCKRSLFVKLQRFF